MAVTKADIDKIQTSAAYYFKHPFDKQTYFSVRFAIRNEHAEKHYVYLFAKANGQKADIIFEKVESLGDEQGMYGGSFHINSAFFLDNEKNPLILFGNIGFDAHIYTIFILEDGELKLLVTGAGDAC